MKSKAAVSKMRAPQIKKPARKPRAYHKGNVAQDLLAAAARVLKTERVEDVSVRRLAREVGVTPANFYNHFPSLNDLLLTLAAEHFDKIRISAQRIIAEKKSRREAILHRSFMFVEFAMANKQIFRIMFGHLPNSIANARFREASNASFGQLMHLVYGKDIFDPAHLERSHTQGRAAYAVFAMIYGLARNIMEDQFQFATGSRAEIRQFVETVMNTLLDGSVAKQLAD